MTSSDVNVISELRVDTVVIEGSQSTAPSTQSSSSKDNTAAIVGGTVGGVLGCAAAVVGGIVIFKAMKAKAATASIQAMSSGGNSTSGVNGNPNPSQTNAPNGHSQASANQSSAGPSATNMNVIGLNGVVSGPTANSELPTVNIIQMT